MTLEFGSILLFIPLVGIGFWTLAPLAQVVSSLVLAQAAPAVLTNMCPLVANPRLSGYPLRNATPVTNGTFVNPLNDVPS